MKRKLELLVYIEIEKKAFGLQKKIIDADGIDLCQSVEDEVIENCCYNIKKKYYSSKTGYVHYIIARHFESMKEGLTYIDALLSLQNGWEISSRVDLCEDEEPEEKNAAEKLDDIAAMITSIVSTKH